MRDSAEKPFDSRGDHTWTAATILLLGAACGILTGFAEAAFLFLQHTVTGRMVFLGRHALWMKPVAEGVVFVSAGVLLLLLGRVWDRARSLSAVAFLYGLLATASVLLLIPPIHPIAKWILAVGVGAQAARLATRWLTTRARMVHRIAYALTGLTAAAVGLSVGRAAVSERAETAALPPAPSEAPNVILLMLDTVRAASMSLYGYDRPTTPELEVFAAQGARFDRAIAPAPWTLPSHASIFTGRQPHEMTADWRRPLDATYPTLAEHLAANGYLTAGFVANMGYVGWESGLSRGFTHYEDHPISLRQAIVESSLLRWLVNHPRVRYWVGSDENFVRKSAAQVNDGFLRWLDRPATDGRPFFAFLNYYDAHGPYQPPEPFRSALASGEPRSGLSPLHRWNSDPFGAPPTEVEIEQEREAYEASIAYLDSELGRLFAELERRELLANSVVIVVSDHGEEFGEHGVFDHGNSLYLEGLHVPLVIRYPEAVPAGQVIDGPVALTDLAATVLDLTDLDGTGLFPGRSLAAWWSEGANEPGPVLSEVSFAPGLPEWFPVSRGDMKSLVGARWHYIRNGDGVEELHDLISDPHEGVDVVGTEAAGDVTARLRRALTIMTQ